MAEFIGIGEAQGYTGQAEFSDSCLAVDLAMLGVGTTEECHNGLVEAKISTVGGESTIPPDGAELTIGDVRVNFGPLGLYFNPIEVLRASKLQFERSQAEIVQVNLVENAPKDHRMHFILLAGQHEAGPASLTSEGDFLVGDSTHEGGVAQRTPFSDVLSRLQRTFYREDILFSFGVGITRED